MPENEADKPGLNLGNIRSLELPFRPLAEQRRVVAYLDDLQAKQDALKTQQAQSAPNRMPCYRKYWTRRSRGSCNLTYKENLDNVR
jgi:hypothetical protein